MALTLLTEANGPRMRVKGKFQTQIRSIPSLCAFAKRRGGIVGLVFDRRGVLVNFNHLSEALIGISWQRRSSLNPMCCCFLRVTRSTSGPPIHVSISSISFASRHNYI
jgi:hypothetical protein